MPSVPRYQSQVREAGLTNARANVQAPIDAFGGGGEDLARAQQGLGQTLARTAGEFAIKERNRADEIAVLEKDNELAQLKTELFYSTNTDPTKGVVGAINRQGKDAFGVPSEYLETFDKKYQEIEGSLSNDRQKQMLKGKYFNYKESLNNQLMQHVYAETKSYDEELTKSRIAVAKNEAALNYQDPEAIAKSIQVQKEEWLKFAQRNGMSADGLKLQIEDSTSKTHASVIERMLAAGDDLQAQKYYDANKEFITTADDREAIDKALEVGSIIGESQRVTDDLMRRHGTMTAALNEAREKIEPGKLRDAIFNRIKDEFNLREAAQRQAKEATFERLALMVDKNGGDLDSVILQNQKSWDYLDSKDRTAIINYAKNKREDKDPETDLAVYYDLMSLATSPETSDDFMKMSLMRYIGSLSKADFKRIVDMQASMRKDGAQVATSGVRTVLQTVTDTLQSAGIERRDDPEEYDKVMRKIEDQVNSLQQQTGKKATAEQVQRIADGQLMKVKIKGGRFFGLFDKEVRRFEVDKGNIEVEADNIPRADRLEIEEYLRAKNRPVTDDAIVDVYNQFQNRRK